jgi:hypothetical protein
LIEHWDGVGWTIVPGPGGRDNPVLYGVSFRSASDGWAVGWHDGNDQSEVDTLLEHWDGTGWKRVPGPDPTFQNYLYGVSMVSANDVWAVGQVSSSQADIRTLVAHWDGTRWSQARSPSPGTGYNILLSVWADREPGQAWAVGSFYPAPLSTYRTLAEQWDGVRWTAVLSQNPSGVSDELFAVTSTSPGDAWAVGRDIADNGQRSAYRTLIEHHC